MKVEMDVVSSTDIQNVQGTWDKLRSLGPTVSAMFYQKLFESNPELRDMFPQDMSRQLDSLFEMLDLAVQKLDDLGKLIPVLAKLGAQHAIQHRVTSDMYVAVGAALLTTLREGLGVTWTKDVEASWTKVYDVVQDTMIAAGDEALTQARRAVPQLT